MSNRHIILGFFDVIFSIAAFAATRKLRTIIVVLIKLSQVCGRNHLLAQAALSSEAKNTEEAKAAAEI